MPGASLALFADLGACHAKSQVLRFAFYPRPLGGRRHQGISQKSNRVSDFYPRPPGGGRRSRSSRTSFGRYFYPRPPGGGRQLDASRSTYLINFYPRPPDGGRSHFSPWKIGYECISIHALWVEGDVLKAVIRITVCISIHALRVEGDTATSLVSLRPTHFYPRPPSGGRPAISCNTGSL